MTDGTSQGLFIVVAIVIFGIFVVLAYILFEDTLSPALASMFTTATEQATGRLNNSNYYHVSVEEIQDENDFLFDKVSNTITKYNGESKNVVIPYEIDGVVVKNIGRDAFVGSHIQSVIFPNTIEVIGREAFHSTNLVDLHIPDSVKEIGYAAFENNNLRSVHLGKGLTRLENEVFRNNKLEYLKIPSNIKDVGDWSLSQNLFVELEIPRTVTRLGDRFIGTKYEDDTLVNLRIPKELMASIENKPSILARYTYMDSVMTPAQKAIVYGETIVTYY